MRRRPFLASLGSSIACSVAGCLGAGQGYQTVPDDYTPANEWEQFGYDARNTHAAVGVEGPVDEPSIEWLYHEAHEPSVLSSDAAVYLHTEEGAPLSVGHHGQQHWETPEPLVTSSPMGPALYESSMLATGREPNALYAFDQSDGTEQWRIDLSGTPGFMPLTVLADDAYLISTEGVTAVHLDERAEAWTADLHAVHPTDASAPTWWSTAATPDHVFTINRDWVAADTEPLYAIDRDTGEIDWTVEIELEPQTRITGPPVVGEELVFVVGWLSEWPDGEADHSAWTRIVAIDPGEENIAWEKTLEGRSNYGVAVDAEQMYITYGIGGPEDHGQLSALDTTDGSIEWTEEIDWMSIPVTVTDEFVYGQDGFHCRAFDRANGTPAWDLDLQDTLVGNDAIEAGLGPYWPVIHNGTWFTFVGENTVAAIR